MSRVLHPLEGVAYCDPRLADHYLREGGWIDSTVGAALARTASRVPDRPAFITDEGSITIRQLDEQTDRLAAALLETGLATGDRAIFQMGTTIETALALLACYKAGIIPVCAVPQYREVEIGHLAMQSQPKAYFVQADAGTFDLVGFARAMMKRHPSISRLVVARGSGSDLILAHMIDGMPLERARDMLSSVRLGCGDVLSFQLSGGTTGIPKIIPRFHGEYLGHSRSLTNCHGLTDDSRLIWSLPLLHNAGQLYILMPVVWGGIGAVLMPKVDIPRMMTLIETHRVTHALSIGPVAPQLLAYQEVRSHDLSSLRLFATMSRSDNLERHIGVPCGNLYGITEGLLLGTPGDAPEKARHDTNGAPGCPLVEIRLLRPGTEEPAAAGETGELCFRGPSSLRGYYRAEQATHESLTSDGLFRSGDMVTAQVIAGKTYYAFQGRLRDNVNRGGEKIGAEEVEACVCRHPAVADAKLVAMPDPIYGEKACVYLILRPGRTAPGLKELADFITAQGLARFKCPERIEVIDAFPVTRVGKVDKPAMRKMIADKLAQEAAAG
jgi:pyochelin biosynthesis protein PchD